MVLLLVVKNGVIGKKKVKWSENIMQKNKKRNIIGIVLLVIAVVLIVMGIVMQNNGNNKTNDNDKDFIDGVAYSGEITGQHCLGTLCIDTLFVNYYDDNTGDLGFMLVNTDEVNVQPSGHFVITPDNSTPLNVYFDEIQVGEMQYVKVSFSDKNVTKMKDYVLSDLVIEENDGV